MGLVRKETAWGPYKSRTFDVCKFLSIWLGLLNPGNLMENKSQSKSWFWKPLTKIKRNNRFFSHSTTAPIRESVTSFKICRKLQNSLKYTIFCLWPKLLEKFQKKIRTLFPVTFGFFGFLLYPDYTEFHLRDAFPDFFLD